MRRSPLLSIDMDFRVIPSTVPLQSPSPDRKSVNLISPTISPNTLQIKRGTTPNNNKQYRYQRPDKNTQKISSQRQTEAKYHSYSNSIGHSIESSQGNLQNLLASAIRQKGEKDQIIRNLRNIIDMITENNRYRKPNQEQQQQLRKQNQKLVNIIEKMSKNKDAQHNIGTQNIINNANLANTTKITEQYENKINQLMKTIKQNQLFHDQETKQLKRFNKSLNAHCKTMQSQKKQLQNQNKKLLKILKQKNEGQKLISTSNNNSFMTQKVKSSDSLQQIMGSQFPNNTQKSQQKLTLMKIREQHSENLKMLKQGLIKQIEQTFDTMKIALQGINIKVNALSKRLESIEKTTWARITKTHVHTQSIKISIRERQNQQSQRISQKQIQKQVQHKIKQSSFSERSFKLQKKNNSQIYIQDAPSSSHQRISRDQFSRLQQVSSQKNLNTNSNVLQQQLSKVKAQLDQYKQKYQKLIYDSNLKNSDRRKNSEYSIQQNMVPLEQYLNLEERYKNIAVVAEERQKQINILYKKIHEIQYENLEEIKRKNMQIRNKNEELQKAKNMNQRQIQEINIKTQEQLQLLVQNYEKQLEILRTQIIALNNQKQESSNNRQQQNLEHIHQLSQQNKGLLQIKNSIQLRLNNTSLELQRQKSNYQILSLEYQQTKSLAESHRFKKQQLQQQCNLLHSQLNQHKNYIQSIKLQLSSRAHQFENIKSLSLQTQDNYRNQLEKNRKLRDTLLERQNQLLKLRQLLADFNNEAIFQKISQTKILLQKNLQEKSILQSTYKKNKSNGLALYEQLSALRKQNQQLHRCLNEKQQLQIKLQHEIAQVQELLQITRTQLKQKESYCSQLIQKISKMEQKFTSILSQQQNSQLLIIDRIMGSSQTALIILDEISNIQNIKANEIKKILEDANNIRKSSDIEE